jgi:hypothetical protein
LPATEISTKAGDEFGDHPILGPVILEQKATHGIVLLFILLGTTLSGAGFSFFFVTRPGQNEIDLLQIILAAVFILCSLACVVLALVKLWRDRGFALYLHSRGIRERRAWGDSVVLFRDVEEMKFQAIRVFVHGAYGGTVEHLAVRTAGPEGKMLYFQRKRQEAGKGKGPDEPSDVNQIATRISGAIAEKMTARLAKLETLAWTPRMRLNLVGIEIEPQHWWERDLRDMAKSIAGWFRWMDGPGDAWPRLDWGQIEGMTIENGIFRLWAKGEPRPRIQVLTGAPNFHPGYAVAMALLQQARVGGQAGV